LNRADMVMRGGASFAKSHGFAYRNIRWSVAVITRGEPACPARTNKLHHQPRCNALPSFW
jgi:hypothetical protein